MSILVLVFWWMLAHSSDEYVPRSGIAGPFIYFKNNLDSKREETMFVFFTVIFPELVPK